MRSWRLTLAIWLMRREGVKRYGRKPSSSTVLSVPAWCTACNHPLERLGS